MTWRDISKLWIGRLASPWVWGGLWVLTVLAFLVIWKVYGDYRRVAEQAYAHPSVTKTVIRIRWHTRTVVGPERIKEVIKFVYLKDGTTIEYHETTTNKAQTIVETSSVTFSSSTASVPVPIPVVPVAVSSGAVSGRLYGFLGWHTGTVVGGMQYVPAHLPITASLGITSGVTPYVAVGVKFK